MVAHNAIDLTGQRFGYLVALHREGHLRRRFALWRCRCDCGQEIVCRTDKLRAGRRKACAINGHRWMWAKFGGLAVKFPSEYRSWAGAHDRCKNKKRRGYKNYGGRGIKVCARWSSFALFLDDLGPKPTLKHTIERNDVNGHYEPGNCRWATKAEQMRNLRRFVYVEYDGQRMLLLDVVAKLGLNRSVVFGRLKMGWSLDESLSAPVRSRMKNGTKEPKIKLLKSPKPKPAKLPHQSVPTPWFNQ